MSKVITDAVKWEADPNYSRSVGTVQYQQKLKNLTVLGRVTATGKYKILAPGASDGTQVAAGVLLGAVDASGGDTMGAVLDGDSLVMMDQLEWPDGITDPQKKTAIDNLDAIGIKACAGA